MPTAVENLIADLLANRYSDVDQNLIAKVQTAILALAEIQSGLNPPGVQQPNFIFAGPAAAPAANAAFRHLVAADINGIAGISVPDFNVVGTAAMGALSFNSLANYYMSVNGADPISVFDANTYLTYARASSTFLFGIGGVSPVAINAGALFPPVTGVTNLGAAGSRWLNVYGFNGNYSGNVSGASLTGQLTNLLAPTNFGSTRHYGKNGVPANTAIPVFTFTLPLDNFATSLFITAQFNENQAPGYASGYINVEVNFSSTGGAFVAPGIAGISSSFRSINSSVISVALSVSATNVAGVCTVFVTATSGGSTGFTNGLLCAQGVLLGPDDNLALAASP